MKSWLVIAAVAGIAFSACLSVPSSGIPPEQPTGDTSPPQKEPPEAKTEEGTALERPEFSRLPNEARDYLQRLARAIKVHDEGFLLDQGEENYATRIRPTVDEESYLALLYRVGAYAEANPDDEDAIPRLEPSSITSLRYTGWEDRGPVIEVRGIMSLKGGKELPCRIMVMWRLKEPRIIGAEP